jgi:hypothetical protein
VTPRVTKFYNDIKYTNDTCVTVYILTEQNCSICFTAAAAAADACAFFLLRDDPTTAVADESVDPGPVCVDVFRFHVALLAVGGPPTPAGTALFVANLTTAAAPLLFATVDFSLEAAALGCTSARRVENDEGTNAAIGATGSSTGGFKMAFGSDKIWFISLSSCSNLIFAAFQRSGKKKYQEKHKDGRLKPATSHNVKHYSVICLQSASLFM